MTSGADPRDVAFRSLAAPGLDEDDLFVAMHGPPVPGPLWGDGRLWARDADDRPWDEEAERRRRHEELLRRWEEAPGRRDPDIRRAR